MQMQTQDESIHSHFIRYKIFTCQCDIRNGNYVTTRYKDSVHITKIFTASLDHILISRRWTGTKATCYHPSTTRSFRRCLSHLTARTSVCDQSLPYQVKTSQVSNICSKDSTIYCYPNKLNICFSITIGIHVNTSAHQIIICINHPYKIKISFYIQTYI